MPSWKKAVRDAYRDYGGVVVSHGSGRSGRLTHYRFPDGATFSLPNVVRPEWAKQQLAVLADRYGKRVEAHTSTRRNGRPRLHLDERLHVTSHARARLTLMDEQAGVDRSEFLRCLTLPQTVLWSDAHGSWLFVRDRLAVAVKEAEVGHVVSTVMWATQEMFEAHPRPEKEGAR